MSRPALLLLTMLTAACVACAAGDDDFDEDPLETSRRERVTLVRLDPAQSAIGAELERIDAATRERYFKAQTAVSGTTPDGLTWFQFYTGTAGPGAIYVPVRGVANAPSPTHAYGSILEEWARWGYERGLGYPHDLRRSSLGLEQEFGTPEEFTPSVANNGLLRMRTMIVDNGHQARVDWRDEYLNSNNPGVPSKVPLMCQILVSTPLPGSYIGPQPVVSLDGSPFGSPEDCPGCTLTLWCGTPPNWQSPGYVSPDPLP